MKDYLPGCDINSRKSNKKSGRYFIISSLQVNANLFLVWFKNLSELESIYRIFRRFGERT